jgi:hypothetical protein
LKGNVNVLVKRTRKEMTEKRLQGRYMEIVEKNNNGRNFRMNKAK